MNRLFANDRPTVLYNPHCDPVLSSWYSIGLEVLEYFYRREDYNLIFAPHVMLFKKKFHIALGSARLRVRGRLPARYESAGHMIIDRGSDRCIDMTYTRAADAYLGDASSQVYEFIARPRPCIFLNPRGARWRDDDNYAHWHLGAVVSSVAELDEALGNLNGIAACYHARQVDAFRQTFAAEGNASENAATAILRAIRKY